MKKLLSVFVFVMMTLLFVVGMVQATGFSQTDVASADVTVGDEVPVY